MSLTADIATLQFSYPQIWFACHVEHHTRQKSALTDRDAGILAHLAEPHTRSAAALARHLGIGKPALSAHLTRLSALGLVKQEADASDARRKSITLTAAGKRELAASSPLDAGRVRAMLEQLSPTDRAVAVAGMRLLAHAARGLRDADVARHAAPRVATRSTNRSGAR